MGGGGGDKKLINDGDYNKREGVKCKHAVFCLRKSAYSQFIPSHGEQYTKWRREQTTALMQCFDSSNKVQ